MEEATLGDEVLRGGILMSNKAPACQRGPTPTGRLNLSRPISVAMAVFLIAHRGGVCYRVCLSRAATASPGVPVHQARSPQTAAKHETRRCSNAQCACSAKADTA